MVWGWSLSKTWKSPLSRSVTNCPLGVVTVTGTITSVVEVRNGSCADSREEGLPSSAAERCQNPSTALSQHRDMPSYYTLWIIPGLDYTVNERSL